MKKKSIFANLKILIRSIELCDLDYLGFNKNDIKALKTIADINKVCLQNVRKMKIKQNMED